MTCIQNGTAIGKLIVEEDYCLNYDAKKETFVSGKCFILYTFRSDIFIVLSHISNVTTFNEDTMCADEHHTNVLCGKCKDGFSLAVNSYSLRCMHVKECDGYKWIIYYTLADLLPVTVCNTL